MMDVYTDGRSLMSGGSCSECQMPQLCLEPSYSRLEPFLFTYNYTRAKLLKVHIRSEARTSAHVHD